MTPTRPRTATRAIVRVLHKLAPPLIFLSAATILLTDSASPQRAAAPASIAAEVRDVRARLHRRLAALEGRMAGASSQEAQAAVAAEIERAKIEAKVELFGVQARQARAAGRLRAAGMLEAAATRLTASLSSGPSATPATPQASPGGR